jgi:DNA-binding NarL/FixJ family response regulator
MRPTLAGGPGPRSKRQRGEVKTHVNQIFAETGARDRTQAIRHAYTHGYADPARGS